MAHFELVEKMAPNAVIKVVGVGGGGGNAVAHMALAKEDRYQRGLHYAIVDEVDSILIDEARTPLIISGPADESQELYHQVDAVVPKLSRQKDEEAEGDYFVDEKGKQVHLSEAGMIDLSCRCDLIEKTDRRSGKSLIDRAELLS